MKALLDDVIINYVEHGSTQGLPVVFIHGFPFSHKMWEPQMQVLPNDIHAIAYDVRGHGVSDIGDGQYTIELFVDDLIGLLDYLVIDKAILCGLSMGGYIALRAIERHPERISGVVLCDTKSEPDTNEAKIKRTASMKIIKSAGVQAFADEFVKSIFYSKTFETNPNAIELIKQIIVNNSSIGICGTLLALSSRTDTTSALSSIKVPVCIIVGEYDALIPPSIAKSMQERIIGSELHMISNAGHMSNLENPEEFNRILLTFLKKL